MTGLGGKATRQETLLRDLRNAIITGEIAQGSHLIQDRLAASYGISRIPLREALRTLESEGLIASEPNRGAVCRPLDAKDVFDLYEVRMQLESFAVRTVASRFTDLRAMTADLTATARAAIARRDLRALIEAETTFHRTIAHATGNEHLLRSLDCSWSLIMRAMHYYLLAENYPENNWREHTEIARSVALGDVDGAQALIEAHIVNSRTAIMENLKAAEYERAAGE